MLGDDPYPAVLFLSTFFSHPDGGTFAMDWRNRDRDQPDLPADAPTLLVIHGLNGHSEEACVLYSMENAHKRGWRAVAMNHRGCGGTHL
ncbi:unnamed protein product, partial [Ectocarpus sp. 8 AP-2014]